MQLFQRKFIRRYVYTYNFKRRNERLGSLEGLVLLIKDVSETIENEAK